MVTAFQGSLLDALPDAAEGETRLEPLSGRVRRTELSAGAWIDVLPGWVGGADALFERASRLPRVEIAEPERLVGRNTVQAMQSGIFYGYIGMVDGILERLLAECPESKVAATGGLSRVIAPHTKHIKHIVLDLTLDGLRTIWFRNQGAGRK